MPRKTRVHVAGGTYHVILRGNARQAIFFDEQDRCYLNQKVAEGLWRYECRLHSFCWMTNHLHAAIQVTNRPLSDLMCWLASGYARYINRNQGRSGHLFERRHCAELVADNEYLLNLVRYIHLNPVKASLVDDPAEYVWSSHRAYLGYENLDWLTIRGVLSCFGKTLGKARRQYKIFMSDNTDWTPSRNMSDSSEALKFDELSVEPDKDSYRRRLDRFVEGRCAAAGIDPSTLIIRGRQRAASRLRARICADALKQGHATLSELANYFRRAPEVIARGIQRHCE